MLDKLKLLERLDRGTVPEPNSGCHLWAEGCHEGGYGVVNIDGAQYRVHRLTWEIERGPIPPGMQVCHKCDVRPCRNIDHLFLGTQADNMSDMAAKGRRSVGERNGNNKLTDAVVLAIRSAAGSQYAIARQFGITQPHVGLIKRRKAWAHVPEGGVLCQ